MVQSPSPLPYFPQRLRRLRRALAVKQTTLAQEHGVDQTTVSRWESGRQTPSDAMQQRVLASLTQGRSQDSALRGLVENACNHVHLVDEATHVCLAYSWARAQDWRTSQQALLGVSLWQFATEEIQQAEAGLAQSDWWSARAPDPVMFHTSGQVHEDLTISAGGIRWERLYLADGTPVRLVSGF